MTLELSIRRYRRPIFCSSTVVNGSGFHLLVGLFCILVTFATFAFRQSSYKTTTAMRSNKCARFQLNVTLVSSFLCMTLIDQNGSGMKFLTRKYRSTTKPSVGN